MTDLSYWCSIFCNYKDIWDFGGKEANGLKEHNNLLTVFLVFVFSMFSISNFSVLCVVSN